jgi:Transposase DDE domain
MKGKARIIEADRSQLSWDLVDLDAWLPADHLARTVWAFTGTLDLSPLYTPIKSVEGEAGRPAIDPRVLLALWLYATAMGSRAAQERAARERLEKVEAARQALEKLKAEREARKKTHAKDESKKKEPAASTTDLEAHRIRFADGAVRAGYMRSSSASCGSAPLNAQLAVTPDHGFIVEIDMTARRNDAGFARPLAEAVEARLGKTPSRLLADTNYATADDIEALGGRAENPITVYAPPQPMGENIKPESLARRLAKLAKEPPAVKQWRQRMETPQAVEMMKKRKRIELANAQTKNRGFGKLTVRGLIKAKALALWHALTHNLMIAIRLNAVTPNGMAAA